MVATIVVLNDGETYTNADNCCIMVIDDEALEMLEEGGNIKDIPKEQILADISLAQVSPPSHTFHQGNRPAKD